MIRTAAKSHAHRLKYAAVGFGVLILWGRLKPYFKIACPIGLVMDIPRI